MKRLLGSFGGKTMRAIPAAAIFALLAGSAFIGGAQAQAVNFGVNLSGGKEPVKIDADDMEVHDREGEAVLTGNVSVVQGDRVLRCSKMIVYYTKSADKTAAKTGTAPAPKPAKKVKSAQSGQQNSFGAKGVDRLEVSGGVFIQNGTQVAVGDSGVFNSKDNIMILTGPNVILKDGQNVAKGCKLTAHMDTGKAFLSSCGGGAKGGRVSVIVNRNDDNGQK